jgi:hypothetical protein
MVYATIAAIVTFTSFNEPDAPLLVKIAEILAVGAAAALVTFVIPAVFNVRRQAQDLEKAER